MIEEKPTTTNEALEPKNSENISDNLSYFNVMPKTKNGPMTTPSIISTTTIKTPPAKPEDKAELSSTQLTSDLKEANGSFFSKHKLYVIGIAGVIILGVFAYFFLPKFLTNPYEDESLLVNTPKKIASTGNAKQDWVINYFGKIDCEISLCGDEADADLDGLVNLKEFELKTDPNNSDSDKDGLADGDEIKIFGSDPLNAHSGVNTQYSDSDYLKNGYDLKTDKKFTVEEILTLSAKMKQEGLHQPTLTTLESELQKIYNFSATIATTSPESLKTGTTTTASALPKDLDNSPEGKQDRDTQRSLTIKNIGIALIKYGDDNDTFPSGDFKQMYEKIRPYLKIATKPEDPINVEPYLYSYTLSGTQTDFSLTYFSETLNVAIKKTAQTAREDKAKEEAAVFDDQRRTDIESIRSALLIYSAENVAGNQEYVFPSSEKYKTSLVPKYFSSIPKDPKTAKDYEYQVSETFATFTLKAVYDAPLSGKTGYLCNQEECRDY